MICTVVVMVVINVILMRRESDYIYMIDRYVICVMTQYDDESADSSFTRSVRFIIILRYIKPWIIIDDVYLMN